MTEKMNAAEYREYLEKRERARAGKYGAIPTQTNDGRTFDSGWEARYYQDRLVEQKAGEIDILICKKVYELVVNNYFICTFELDFEFRYTPKSPHYSKYAAKKGMCYVDTKSTATITALFKMKQRLMKALYDIDVEAVLDPSLKPDKRVKK